MFAIQSYTELEKQISRLSDEKKNYFRRRWYLWKCSECDEYLFYKNENVLKNPDRYDKVQDVRIDGNMISTLRVQSFLGPKSIKVC